MSIKNRLRIKWSNWKLLANVNANALHNYVTVSGRNRDGIHTKLDITLFKYKPGELPNARLQLYIGIEDGYDYRSSTHVMNGFKIYSGLRFLESEVENELVIPIDDFYIQLGDGRGVYIHYDETVLDTDKLTLLIVSLARVYLKVPDKDFSVYIIKPGDNVKSMDVTDTVPEILC